MPLVWDADDRLGPRDRKWLVLLDNYRERPLLPHEAELLSLLVRQSFPDSRNSGGSLPSSTS